MLNHESKNARAYLGKKLAVEHCRTLDDFILKRKQALQTVSGEQKMIPAEEDHINNMVKKYTIRKK